MLPDIKVGSMQNCDIEFAKLIQLSIAINFGEIFCEDKL